MKVNLDRINSVLETASLVFIVLMLTLVWIQVFMRYVLNFSPFWIEAAARYFMIWALLLSAAFIISKDEHIRMDFLIQIIPPRIARPINIVLKVVALVFLIIFAVFGLESAITQLDVRDGSLRISMFWPFLIVPMSGFLMIVNLLVNIWKKGAKQEQR